MRLVCLHSEEASIVIEHDAQGRALWRHCGARVDLHDLPPLAEARGLASFAMDDVILYLDTHPDDRNALNYYRYVVALRKESVKAYEASFGPLTIEDADDACTWSWLTERWPWEGEV